MTDEARALVDKLQAQTRWKHSKRRSAASLPMACGKGDLYQRRE